MTKQTTLEGKWDKAKGRVKEAWGALTDDDIRRADGKWDRLVGTIREKSGETVEAIESKLDRILDKVRDAGPDTDEN